MSATTQTTARQVHVVSPIDDDWDIDISTGTPILVCRNCSVIEAEHARYVMRLIEADRAAPAAPITLTPAHKADAALFEGPHFTVFATPQETS